MDLELTIIIIVFICGLLAMGIELFIPGAVMGMLGFVAVVGSIVFAVINGYMVTAAILITCTIAFVPFFFVLWKGVVGRYFAITSDQKGFRSSTTIDESLVGCEGMTLSPLRPSGIAQLNGKRYDVVTRGEMLEKGTRIAVIEVSGNRVVVRKL